MYTDTVVCHRCNTKLTLTKAEKNKVHDLGLHWLDENATCCGIPDYYYIIEADKK